MTPALWDSFEEEFEFTGELAGLNHYEVERRMRAGEVPERECDILIRTRSGEKRWLHDAEVMAKDEQGIVIGAMGIFYDITERKQAEEALQQLADSTFEAIAIHDKGIIMEVNPSFCRMYGYERSEVIGKSALDLTAPESREMLL